MSIRFMVLTALVFILATRIIFDIVRIILLKRFAAQSGIAISGNLWWNNREVQRITNSLPNGPIKTRVKFIQAAQWPLWATYAAIYLFIGFREFSH